MSEEQTTIEPIKHPGGVKTPEGKAVSRYNAQRHAILRETITEYEQTNAEQFYNDLADDLMPTGRTQELLVEMLASNTIKLQRIAKAEAEVIKEALFPNGLRDLKFSDNAYLPVVSASLAEKLSLYSRYQTATENRVYRALIMLKQLKTHEQS